MKRMNPPTLVCLDLGVCPYATAWQKQGEWARRVEEGETAGALLLVEHPPVLTLGRSAREEDLGRPRADWIAEGVEVVDTDRGGKITYHGPGQIVLYPVVHLRMLNLGLHDFIRGLERVGMAMLAAYGIAARQDPKHTGVWVGDAKIAAIGIHVRRWITTHGMAMNINNTSDIFSRFIPCGITDRGVTSLRELLGHEVSLKEARQRLKEAFEMSFGVVLQPWQGTRLGLDE